MLQMATRAVPKAAVRDIWTDVAPLQRSVLQHFLVMVYPAVRRAPDSVWLQREEARQPRDSRHISLLMLKAAGGHDDEKIKSVH